MNKILLYIVLLLLTNSAYSKHSDKIPRFVATKSDHVNARKGPGITYPLSWVFVKKSVPLKIISEFEDWRKVEDMKGYAGWVHSSVLTRNRSAIVTCQGQCNMHKSKNPGSKIVAILQNGLICNISKVSSPYTRLVCKNIKGWVLNSDIWGLLGEEK
mgnify:FL=1